MSLPRRPTSRTRRPRGTPRRAFLASPVHPLEDRRLLSTATMFLGLTAPRGDGSQHLIRFNSSDPGTVVDLGAITGVDSGYTLDGLAQDSSTGDVFAVAYSGSSYEFYQIDTNSLAVTNYYANNWAALGVPPVAFASDNNGNLDLYETETNQGDPSGPHLNSWYSFQAGTTSYSGYNVNGPMPIAAATTTPGSLIGVDSGGNLISSSDGQNWSTVAALSPGVSIGAGTELAVDSLGDSFVSGTVGVGYQLDSLDTTTGATSSLGTIPYTLYGLGVTRPYFTVTGITGPVTAGASQTITVTAYNGDGTADTGYSGTVHFTSSDPNAVLPSDATLTGGTGTFNVTFTTAGTQSITATDTADGTDFGSETGITVAPGAATKLVVSAPSTATAGVWRQLTVTAQDAFGNTATGY